MAFFTKEKMQEKLRELGLNVIIAKTISISRNYLSVPEKCYRHKWLKNMYCYALNSCCLYIQMFSCQILFSTFFVFHVF